MEKQRKKTLVISVAMALLMLLVGTFAWTSFTQRALNEKEGSTELAGGRIHDDYNKDTNNKDIYAENYDQRPVLVRLKLSEYMELKGTSLVSEASKEDRNTWSPYTLPEDDDNPFRQYVSWKLGGSKDYLPTFNTDPTSLETDAAGDAIDYIANGVTHPGAGNQNDFVAGNSYNNLDGSDSHDAEATLTEDRPPMSMEDWKALPDDQKVGKFWVIDADGWAYWAQFLNPGEATSLLLDHLNFDSEATDAIGGDWYYAIDVVGEMVTEDEINRFFNSTSELGDGSEDAQVFIEVIRGVTYELVISGEDTIAFNGTKLTKQYTAQLTQNDPATGATANITGPGVKWTVEGNTSTDTDISRIGLLTVAANETSTKLTIKAESETYPTVIGTYEVTLE